MATNKFTVLKQVELNGQQLNLYSCNTVKGCWFKCTELVKVFGLVDSRRFAEKVSARHKMKPNPDAKIGKAAAWYINYKGLKKAVGKIRKKECSTLLRIIRGTGGLEDNTTEVAPQVPQQPEVAPVAQPTMPAIVSYPELNAEHQTMDAKERMLLKSIIYTIAKTGVMIARKYYELYQKEMVEDQDYMEIFEMLDKAQSKACDIYANNIRASLVIAAENA